MEDKQKAHVEISLADLHGRERKKEVKRVTREITKDKKFKKAVRHASHKNEGKIPKEIRDAAVMVAVEATMGAKAEAKPQKKSGLEVYADLVGKFAAARRKSHKKKKKNLKAAKKDGYNPATGLYVLKKDTPIKKAKPNKPYKPKKVKK